MDAFRRARAAIIENAPDPLPPVACGGAAVTLRLDGAVIARGQSFGGDRPFENAITAAKADLAARFSAARDAVAERAIAADLRRATLSLELAGALVPVTIQLFGEADLTMAPGLDGVAVRQGDRVEGMFPASAMLGGKTPGEALASAISILLQDATVALPNTPGGEAGPLARSHGFTYYRFRVAHIAEPAPGLSPSFLTRGMRTVQPGDISAASLQTLADGLAQSLIGRSRVENARLYPIGTYNPVTNRAEPNVASMSARATVAMSLARYARTTSGASALSATAASRDILKTLLRPLRASPAPPPDPKAPPGTIPPVGREAEPQPWENPVDAALVLLAIRELSRADMGAPPMEESSLVKIDAAIAGAYSAERGWSGVDAFGRAIVACALAARAAVAPELQQSALRAQAEAAVRSLFRNAPVPQLAPQMPWLLWAELDLAGKDPVPAASVLREFRTLAWKNQVVFGDTPDLADLGGGIVFSGGLNPYPTWTTAKLLDSAAVMLADPRLTDRDEILPEIGRLIASLRFLRQLSTDEFSAYLAMDRTRAINGIRTSPWDPHQPPEATAHALIAICDSLSAMRSAQERLRVQVEP